MLAFDASCHYICAFCTNASLSRLICKNANANLKLQNVLSFFCFWKLFAAQKVFHNSSTVNKTYKYNQLRFTADAIHGALFASMPCSPCPEVQRTYDSLFLTYLGLFQRNPGCHSPEPPGWKNTGTGNDVCKFQVATVHLFGGVLGTDSNKLIFVYIIDKVLRLLTFLWSE